MPTPDPECVRALSGQSFASFHDDHQSGLLTAAFIRVSYFSAPVVLAGCRIYYESEVPTPTDFVVTVVNAGRDGEDNNVIPTPIVSVTSVECPGVLPTITTSTTTTTTSTTLPDGCGDGVTDDGEECDDGNISNTDGCTRQCEDAVCGDGYVFIGVEHCDDGNGNNADMCPNSCRLPSAGATCELTFHAATIEPIGALQWSTYYGSAPGGFEGSGASVSCTNLVSQAIFFRNDVDESRTLVLGVIGKSEFSEMDIARCDFLASDFPSPQDFEISIHDAIGPGGEPIDVDIAISSIVCPAGCGSGLIDYPERCDDGNVEDGDGCDSNCTPTSCGNGIVTAGEECDDADSDDSDDCLSTCKLATCGDGLLEVGVESCDDGNQSNLDDCLASCAVARCGDGFVHSADEECDDGDSSNSNSCTNVCMLAECGDGYVRTGIEGCDDGGVVDGDGCDSNCTETACGNGILTGDEQCDDGILSPTGDCVPGCTTAVCGDAYTQAGREDCDDANTSRHDGCDQCEIRRVCGDATGDRKILANDALRTLQRAIGVDVDCPDWVCDINSNGIVAASDALSLLKASVGLVVELECGDPTALVLRLNSTFLLSSLQVDVNYQGAAGDIPGAGASVQCEGLLEAVNLAVNDKPTRVLSVSFLALGGFSGPRSIVRCNFEPTGNVDTSDFGITVLDATNPAGNTVFGVGVLAIPY